MANSTKIALLIVALIFVPIFYQGYQVWKEAEKSAEFSCLGSIASATAEARKSGQLQLNEKSRELTKEEIDTLIKQGKIGDCGGKKYIFENLHIAIGDVNKKSKSSIKVWTSGNDGISGTIDDVVFPWKETNE